MPVLASRIRNCTFNQKLHLHREEKSVHNHHRKKNLLENCSGLKEKLSRPVVDTKTLFKKKQENHIHHRNLSSADPIFLQRKVLHWSRAVYGFLSPVVSQILTLDRGQEKNTNFFNISFLAPTLKQPLWAPGKIVPAFSKSLHF